MCLHKASVTLPHMTDIQTSAVHGGRVRVPANRPAVAPLFESAAWTFENLDELDAIQERELAGVIYGSLGGPNHAALESLLAAFENAEAAVCANGGMTAIAACLHHLLRPGDRIVVARELFGPTTGLLSIDLARAGVVCEQVDATDLEAVERALEAGRTTVVYAETLSNPRLRVVDIRALATLAHRHGAYLVIDNTFASPALCRPLELGADLVVESLTKYVAGHYDCLAGIVAGSAELVDSMRPAMLRAGLLPSPFDAWLCARGARTFPLRLAAASRSAAHLAAWLETQDGVTEMLYPGLPSHPDHEVASRVLPSGCGAVLSFALEGGRPHVARFIGALEMIVLVSSLGGVATTINHPTSTSHRDLDGAQRSRTGIHDGLVRLAVGIEAIDDVQADLAAALQAARPVVTR